SRPFFDLLKGMRDFAPTNVSAVLHLPVQQAWTVSLQKASPVPFADIRRPFGFSSLMLLRHKKIHPKRSVFFYGEA
ncbi:hypothetical protein, partial [Sinanaerobacter chloroacetimidivorans]